MTSMRWTEDDLERVLLARSNGKKQMLQLPVQEPKSKYANTKVIAHGVKFDSKREAAYYETLLLREKAGEINNLQRQVPFSLTTTGQDGMAVEVAEYIADFVYFELGTGMHVLDAKGHKTRMYALKKKWLYLQSGIEIEEV